MFGIPSGHGKIHSSLRMSNNVQHRQIQNWWKELSNPTNYSEHCITHQSEHVSAKQPLFQGCQVLRCIPCLPAEPPGQPEH